MKSNAVCVTRSKKKHNQALPFLRNDSLQNLCKYPSIQTALKGFLHSWAIWLQVLHLAPLLHDAQLLFIQIKSVYIKDLTNEVAVV